MAETDGGPNGLYSSPAAGVVAQPPGWPDVGGGGMGGCQYLYGALPTPWLPPLTPRSQEA